MLVISAYEISGMIKKQQKKEIIIFSIFAALTLGFGIFYLSDPYKISLAQQALRLIGKQF